MSRSPNEDVYDFDHLLDGIKDQMVEGETYSFDKRGRLVRDGRKKYSQEGVIKLPKLPVGQSRGHARGQIGTNRDHQFRPQTTDTRIKMTCITAPRDIDATDWHRERSRLNGPRQPQKEPDVGSHQRHGTNGKTPMVDGSVHAPAPPHNPPANTYSKRRVHHVTAAHVPSRDTSTTHTSQSLVGDTAPLRTRPEADVDFANKNDYKLDNGHIHGNQSTATYVPTAPRFKSSQGPSYSTVNRKFKYQTGDYDDYDDLDDDTKEILEMGKKFEESNNKMDMLIKECERHLVGDGSLDVITDATADLLLEELDEIMKSPSSHNVKSQGRHHNPMPYKPAVADDKWSVDIDDFLPSPRNGTDRKLKHAKKVKENVSFLDDLDDILISPPATAHGNRFDLKKDDSQRRSRKPLKDETDALIRELDDMLDSSLFNDKVRSQSPKKDDTDVLIKELDEMLYSPTQFRPNSVAIANTNVAGCSTPMRMPAAAQVPRMTAEPLKQWNGETAKRGVGFKSKLRREEVKVRRPEDDIVPDRIRRRMQEYNKTLKNV